MNTELEILGIYFLSSPFLLGIFLIPLILYFYNKRTKSFALNNGVYQDLQKIFGKKSNYFIIGKNILLGLILLIFVFILADPHLANNKQKITKNGIDIVLALDISKSMEATDLQPSRIIKAQDSLIDFIQTQTTNRVGLVLFAGKPISSIPLTFDYGILEESLSLINTDSLAQNVPGLDGTAIGDALLMSKNMFEKNEMISQGFSKTQDEQKGSQQNEREKVVILLTDGDANRGVDPVLASKLLAESGITIYTLGIGSLEGGEIEFDNGLFTQKVTIPPLNTASLREVADITGGYFFRATDNGSIEKIFAKLSELEKNDIEVEVIKRYTTFYLPFVYTLIFLLFFFIIIEIRKPRA